MAADSNRNGPQPAPIWELQAQPAPIFVMIWTPLILREAKPGVFQTGAFPGRFPLFSGKVRIVSRTLSGLFLFGAVNRPRKRKRTNRENPRRVLGQIGKIPEKSGKSQKGQKRTKKEGQIQIGKPPRLKTPRLGALDSRNPQAAIAT